MSVTPQCFYCRQYIGRRATGGYQCQAYFVEPIPNQILLNEHDHAEPFPGDSGILYNEMTEDELKARREASGNRGN